MADRRNGVTRLVGLVAATALVIGAAVVGGSGGHRAAAADAAAPPRPREAPLPAATPIANGFTERYSARTLHAFGRYPQWWAGESIAGLKVTTIMRIRGRKSDRPAGDPGRTEMTSIVYGDCDASEHACPPPLELLVSPACAVAIPYLDWHSTRGAVSRSYTLGTMRGARVAHLRALHAYVVQTGTATIRVFGASEALERRAIAALVPANAAAAREAARAPAGRLPAPTPAARAGALRCTNAETGPGRGAP